MKAEHVIPSPRPNNGGRPIPKAVFPVSLIRLLAVDDFVNLATADERAAWAKANGVERPLSPQLMKIVRDAHKNRETNKRLGLPDPLRETTKGGR